MADQGTTNSSSDESNDGGRMFVAAVLLEGGLAPLALVLGWWLGTPPLERFAWDARDAAIGALAALPMHAFFRVMIRRPAGPLARAREFLDAVLGPILRGRPMSDLALISLAAGVGEELLFRGFLQGDLSRRLGPWAGLGVASVIFGLLHPITTNYVAIAALLGTYLGVLWMATGNLLAPIVAHALYDFLALRDLLRGDDEVPDGSD